MNTEKKKYRFNAIDAIVIVLIAAVVAFCAYKMVGILEFANDAGAKTYTVTVEMKKINIEICEQFAAGDDIYARTDDTYLGKIVNVSYVPAKEFAYSSETGEVKEVMIEGKYDIVFVLEIKSGEDFGVGKFISFRTDRAVASGYAITSEVKGAAK